MPSTKKQRKKAYSAKDLKEVSRNPEWTKESFAKARPSAEVFPELATSIGRNREPNKKKAAKLRA